MQDTVSRMFILIALCCWGNCEPFVPRSSRSIFNRREACVVTRLLMAEAPCEGGMMVMGRIASILPTRRNKSAITAKRLQVGWIWFHKGGFLRPCGKNRPGDHRWALFSGTFDLRHVSPDFSFGFRTLSFLYVLAFAERLSWKESCTFLCVVTLSVGIENTRFNGGNCSSFHPD